MNKQKRYEETEKGKEARSRAHANYKANHTTWTCHIQKPLSDAVLAKMPEGMTRTALLEKLFQQYLDIGM
jgi:hypothetical protein